MMKLTIALIFAFLSTTAVYAEIYNYSCKACLFPRIVSDDGYDGCDVVDGKTYPLRVDDDKNVLEWRGKKYRTVLWIPAPKCEVRKPYMTIMDWEGTGSLIIDRMECFRSQLC